MSDVFRNLKGTSKTEFRLGLANRGSGLYSGTSDPASSYTVSAGDIWFDKNNQRLAIRTGGGAWADVTNTSVVDNRITNFTNNDATFAQNVTVTGNLTVSGTTTTINTQELNIADNEIVLNSDLASNQAATANAGILINRGNEGNVFLRWDEGEGEWTVNGETFSAGALIGNLSGNVTGSIAPNGVANTVRANTLIVTGSTATAKFGDNAKANFGASDDLQIYHDGTNSYIDDAGTGSIFLRSGTTYFQNLAGTKTSIQTNSGGAQTFYHNNSAKLATSATGISVTGTVDVNGAYTLPTSDGSANQVLTTDGSGSLSFSGIPAGGSNTQIQFNDSGSLNGESSFVYDKSDDKLTVKNLEVTRVLSRVQNYGSITSSAGSDETFDYGAVTGDDRDPVSHDSYTVAEANALSGLQAGDMIFVSNETGGATMAFYDGSDWRRIQDRAVIS